MTPSPELPLHIDSTMISCFRSCPKKFYEEFVLGLRGGAISIDLLAGGCFASALENVYRGHYQQGLSQGEALMRAYGAFLQQWGDPEIIKDTPKTRERVWEAVEEYFNQWGLLTDAVKPYMVSGVPAFEFTFGIPLAPSALAHNGDYGVFPEHPSGQPFLYSGRFDMLGDWNGKIVVRDEKTTTSIGASWANKWDLRSQFMGYCWACQQSGLDVDTVCVRGVGILKTKFTLVEAFKTYPKHLIARWHEQLRRDLWAIRRCWDEGYWDFDFADSCEAYGGCVFRDVCASPEPDRWRQNFQVKRWNPLNKNPIEEKVA